MAKSDRNSITRGYRGKIGKVVYRIVNGKTVVSSVPVFSETPSEAQAEKRGRFASVVSHAKTLLLDPVLEAEYREIAKAKKLTSAFQAAVSDCGKPIKLEKIFIGPNVYGLGIGIYLEDNFKGKEMQVSLLNGDGGFIETGNATFQFGASAWHYTARPVIEPIAGVKVVVTVKDRPGNCATFEKVL